MGMFSIKTNTTLAKKGTLKLEKRTMVYMCITIVIVACFYDNLFIYF